VAAGRWSADTDRSMIPSVAPPLQNLKIKDLLSLDGGLVDLCWGIATIYIRRLSNMIDLDNSNRINAGEKSRTTDPGFLTLEYPRMKSTLVRSVSVLKSQRYDAVARFYRHVLDAAQEITICIANYSICTGRKDWGFWHHNERPGISCRPRARFFEVC
jgi:hypothetical protein